MKSRERPAMVEAQTDVKKYSSHPVSTRGDIAALRNVISELEALDRRAEWRARLWLGPGVLATGPMTYWAQLSEPWRTLWGIISLPIWIVPAILLTVLFPFTLIWAIGYAILGSKDISNDLLKNARQFLEEWEQSGLPLGDDLCLTIDARSALGRSREISLQDLREDPDPGIFSAGETACFRFETRGLALVVTQQVRVFYRRAGVGETVSNFLSESDKIEVQSWYEVSILQNERTETMAGPIQTLPGRKNTKTNLIDYYGKTLNPEFPRAEIREQLSKLDRVSPD